MPPVTTALGLTRVVNRTRHLTADVVTRVDRVGAAVPEACGAEDLRVPKPIRDGRASRREVGRNSHTYAWRLTREDPRVGTEPWSRQRVLREAVGEREDRACARTPLVPPETWWPWVAVSYRSHGGHTICFDIVESLLLRANPLETLFASRASSPADVRLPFGAAQRLARCVQEGHAAWRPGSAGFPGRAADPDLFDLVLCPDAARARGWRPL